ncbi:ketoacyl-ACP synthase III [Priestia koreensis]|uniref:ketoacyl-ACP synthase III n=1 Tax=Priestia koreensis TaxID=284581 RepID=UPI002040AA72|nr:ketoacyl-ACP synthase III [Priestia koreensis]MCM3006148.1 ketoacyl-ACP synthase III [Priestia koreensis]
MKSTARLTAISTYVPERRLTNADLEKLVDTNDEWITQRTGMKERRIAGEMEFSSTLACRAIEDLLARYETNIHEVDCILVATTTADYAFPSVACQIQQYFNIPQASAMDLNATCAGFTYALHMANGFVTSGLHQKVLVIAAETLSKVTDYRDRSTCVLFGDGAAAMLVEYDSSRPSFLSSHTGTYGQGGKHIYRTNLSTTMQGENLLSHGKMVQNGREVYKWAVRNVPHGMNELLEMARMTQEEISWFVPHSANLRMIESICEKSRFPLERTLTSVENHGNTSAVSIPLALDIALKEGKLQNGDTVLLYGFGGGLTYAGHLLTWHLKETK